MTENPKVINNQRLEDRLNYKEEYPEERIALDEIIPKDNLKLTWIAKKVWESTLVLDLFLKLKIFKEYLTDEEQASCLKDNTSETQPRILEMGSGTGVGGLLLAECFPDYDVILSDLPEALPFLSDNIAANASAESAETTTAANTTDNFFYSSHIVNHTKVIVAPVAWGETSHSTQLLKSGPLHIIFCCDVVYFIDLFDPLISSLRELCTKDTHIFFFYKMRTFEIEEEFFMRFGKYFIWERVINDDIFDKFEINEYFILHAKLRERPKDGLCDEFQLMLNRFTLF